MGEVAARDGDEPVNDGGGEVKGGSSGGAVKWGRFLPRMVLRVLLVEADDSTRQIITALLRKCNYRVAAVPDGLKAWEILKGRPNNIDLILTEFDLPSISGYPLLTLVMEHDICKNIPVIIMSSEDSISTVYKCMMRGAADYLVKPVRTNELRNLWQHVWRRQSSTVGATGEEDDECAALQNVEATAENNAVSNRSSGNGDKELAEKGNDAQSSCTKPDADSDVREKEHDRSNEVNILSPEDVRSSERSSLGQEKESDEGFAVARSSQNKETNPEIPRMEANGANVASGCNDFTVNSYKEAINLIGAIDNNPRSICMGSSSNYYGMNTQPELGLFLRQSDPSCLTDPKCRESNTVKRSDASAFSRYISKPLHFEHSGFHNLQNQEQEPARNTEEDNYCADKGSNNTDNVDAGEGCQNLGSAQTGHSEYYTQQQSEHRVFPGSIPVRGVVARNQSTDYGCLQAQHHTQSSPLPRHSPSSATQQEPLFRIDSYQQSSCENNNFGDQKASNSPNDSRGAAKFDSLEDHLVSGNTEGGGSGNSSFCNGGTLTHLNSMDGGSICGSNENNNQFQVSRPPPAPTTSAQRTLQREAALAKFRLKRKDRCYDKKVRYESRKKLAEQRPRVKGQFVRQQTQSNTDFALEEETNA